MTEEQRLPSYGGQAVMDGVMMRSERMMAVAVRAPSGEIVLRREPLPRRLYGTRWSKLPLLRGVLALWDALGIGMKAMFFSANVGLAGQGVQLQGPSLWATVGVAVAVALGLFFALPALVASGLDPLFGSAVWSNTFEGALRLALLVGYVWAIGHLPDVRRVFAYHGAEHKTINAFEAGAPLVPRVVAGFSARHVRCGTSFLLFVVVVSTIVFLLLGHQDWAPRLISRLVLIPLVAAIAYELIKLGARAYDRGPLFRACLAPGLALQALTTREPDLAQIEVAIAALEAVLEAERPDLVAAPPVAAAA